VALVFRCLMKSPLISLWFVRVIMTWTGGYSLSPLYNLEMWDPIVTPDLTVSIWCWWFTPFACHIYLGAPCAFTLFGGAIYGRSELWNSAYLFAWGLDGMPEVKTSGSLSSYFCCCLSGNIDFSI
jgi:hypothetical protein